MIASLNWIGEYVDLNDVAVEDLAARLTEASCEVEKIVRIDACLEHIYTVKIDDVTAHPASDKLQIAAFSLRGKEFSVVCGAPNLKKGLVVPFVAVGVELPGGLVIAEQEIRGVKSAGMLASERELGISEDHAGLMELPESTPIGVSLAIALNLRPDILLEIDNKSITHRPDLWGIFGLAREIAALYDRPFKSVFTTAWRTALLDQFEPGPSVNVKVESPVCLGYAGLTVTGVGGNDLSPIWMRRRLLSCGVRPINALVDASNYAMLETGLPNHFYDYETIKNDTIFINQAPADAEFITLDDKPRKIIAGDTLVYTQGDAALVLAGIMGGQTSMVKPETTKTFIECAVWDGAAIRKTSLRIGLRTDSSIRFEKALDPGAVTDAALRCLELTLKAFPLATPIGTLVETAIKRVVPQPITVDIKRAGRLLGIDLTRDMAKNYLSRLGYAVGDCDDKNVTVTPPTYRCTKELQEEPDVYEEIGRMHGYGAIAPQTPLWPLSPRKIPNRVMFERKTGDFMVLHARALEIFTHPMTGVARNAAYQWPETGEELKLANSVNPERDRMRTSLIPSFLEAVEINRKNFSSFRFFELGRTFAMNRTAGHGEDVYRLGVVFFRQKTSPFMELVDVVESYFNFINLPCTLEKSTRPNPLLPDGWSGIHPVQRLDATYDGKSIGYINALHPLLSKELKIKGHTVIFEIDVTSFMDLDRPTKSRYAPLPRYPFSNFDCTVEANKRIEAADLLKIVVDADIPFLLDVKVADVFTLSETKKTITLRSELGSLEKTLGPDEIKMSENAIIQALLERGYPLKS